MRRKYIFLLALIILLVGVVGYYKFTPLSLPVVVNIQNVEIVTPTPTDKQTSAVTLYAYEKDGSHIFDGAVIAAINSSTGRIVAEQVAEGDGKVVFLLPAGTYRFQPSPFRENRVVGSLKFSVPLNENKPQTLLLTEIGPGGFGVPVDTCSEKNEALDQALKQANYCEVDADCKTFQPGGFSCGTYVNKSFDGATVLQRVNDYARGCPLTAYKCPGIWHSPMCVQGVCNARE